MKHVAEKGLSLDDIADWISATTDFATAPTPVLLADRLHSLCTLLSTIDPKSEKQDRGEILPSKRSKAAVIEEDTIIKLL